MFKKLLLMTTILVSGSTFAAANSGAPYLGASVGINDTTTSGGGIYRGVPATVYAGYGAALNKNIYLGGEILGTLGTGTLNNTTYGAASLRTTYGYGASLIPGVLLNDNTMAFARAGVVRSRFSDANDTVTGGQIGLGMQTNLMQNWDLRGEYDYTKYGSIGNMNPHTDLFNVGLIYKIN